MEAAGRISIEIFIRGISQAAAELES